MSDNVINVQSVPNYTIEINSQPQITIELQKQGARGNSATVAVGTTTTLPAGSNATVENVGSTSEAIFNFSIPRGTDGGVTEAHLQSELSLKADISDLELKADITSLTAHTSSTSNPHSVTKSQVGLGNVPNLDCSNANNISSGTLADARLTIGTTPADYNLSNLTATGKATSTNLIMPNYSAIVDKTWNTSYTAPSDGWIFVSSITSNVVASTLTINSLVVWKNSSGPNGDINTGFIPIAKGSTYIATGGASSQVIKFIPVKGA